MVAFRDNHDDVLRYGSVDPQWSEFLEAGDVWRCHLCGQMVEKSRARMRITTVSICILQHLTIKRTTLMVGAGTQLLITGALSC